jgi:hypothetical protein
MYWSAWRDIAVRFETQHIKRVPEHWLRFGQRHSLLSKPSPCRAINPANALLNYLYAILVCCSSSSLTKSGDRAECRC